MRGSPEGIEPRSVRDVHLAGVVLRATVEAAEQTLPDLTTGHAPVRDAAEPSFAIGVVRASYSRYYQHPQVATIEGPVLGFALREGFDFLPLQGERDEIWEVGVGVPIHGWTLDFDAFHNTTHNLVDHEVLGNSNLLFPLTIDNGRVRAFESTVRSPSLPQDRGSCFASVASYLPEGLRTCCEIERMFPSGSLNHATRSPFGGVHTPN